MVGRHSGGILRLGVLDRWDALEADFFEVYGLDIDELAWPRLLRLVAQMPASSRWGHWQTMQLAKDPPSDGDSVAQLEWAVPWGATEFLLRAIFVALGGEGVTSPQEQIRTAAKARAQRSRLERLGKGHDGN